MSLEIVVLGGEDTPIVLIVLAIAA